jgi:transposase InsO family protein
VQRFERDAPNQLWQVDHKGPVEVERRPVTPLTVIDDHSRYCLAFRPLDDKTMATAFAVLWDVFGDAGLPEAILSDNAFNTTGVAAPGLSWFDSRLLRLGIRPAHGRPYHPQTQGKCERLNGTGAREFIYFNARRDRRDHFDQDAERWRGVYNVLRPHEALGDRPPARRTLAAQRAAAPRDAARAGLRRRPAHPPHRRPRRGLVQGLHHPGRPRPGRRPRPRRGARPRAPRLLLLEADPRRLERPPRQG